MADSARAFFASLPDPDDTGACQARLDVLMSCDCCEAHQKDKPRLYKPWVETKKKGELPTSTETKQCKCICRHEGRQICRRHPDWPNPW